MKLTVNRRILIIFLCVVLVLIGGGIGLYIGLGTKGHTHIYGEWQVIKDATCTEDGLLQRFCSLCNDAESDVISKGHLWQEYKIDTEPTTVSNGSMSLHCARCNNIKGTLVIPKLSENPAVDSATFIVVFLRTNGELYTASAPQVYFYDKDNREIGNVYAQSGIATKTMSSGIYNVTLSNIARGYKYDDSYEVNSVGENDKFAILTVTLKGEIMQGDGSEIVYSEGDVIYDFTVFTVDGEEITLSELLKARKAVLINFYYNDCPYCEQEFPAMVSAYNKYKEDIAVICFNRFDQTDEIKTYRDYMRLPFYMVRDTTGYFARYNVTRWPKSVLIDREGIICKIMGVATLSEFNKLFEEYATK